MSYQDVGTISVLARAAGNNLRKAAEAKRQTGWSRLCKDRFTPLNERLESTKGMTTVRDNKVLGRFELDVEGAVAFANYRMTPQAIVITHTETPRALRGRGVASELIKGSLDLIRADGHKVIAGCGFVVDYLYKHPEYADLMA